MSFVESLFILISCLLTSGFFTLFERKLMASVQFRKGPNKILLVGLLQPIADAMKLMFKTNVSNESSIDFSFYFSPFISFMLSMVGWLVLPVVWGLFNWSLGVLFILVYFSLSVYGVMSSGWFSRSKYSSLGCIRSLSQSVSYEIPLSTSLIVMVIMFSCPSLLKLNGLQDGVYFIFPFFSLFIVLLIVFLAEINRAPFDLAEGESELVSGFSVELGSTAFVLVFLSEYLSLVWCCVLLSLLFLGSVGLMLGVKVIVMMSLMVFIRCSFPRVRFDHVMILCWLMVLPILFFFIFIFLLILFNQSQSGGMLLLMTQLNYLFWLN